MSSTIDHRSPPQPILPPQHTSNASSASSNNGSTPSNLFALPAPSTSLPVPSTSKSSAAATENKPRQTSEARAIKRSAKVSSNPVPLLSIAVLIRWRCDRLAIIAGEAKVGRNSSLSDSVALKIDSISVSEQLVAMASILIHVDDAGRVVWNAYLRVFQSKRCDSGRRRERKKLVLRELKSLSLVTTFRLVTDQIIET